MKPRNQKCSAHSSQTGRPCQKWAMNGTTVCRWHGGAAPQVKRKAQERLNAAADDAAEECVKIAMNTELAARDRIVAIREILTRAGVSEQVERTETSVVVEFID